MTKHTKEGAGGVREGAGPPQKYGEETVTVFGRRVPKSQESDYRAWYKETCDPKIDKKLKTYIKKPKGKQS